MIAFFIFLTALPVLGVLGHDLYLYYLTPDRGFELSALGYLWTRYEPESYRATLAAVDPAALEHLNDLLTQKALYIALVPFLICVVIGVIVKVRKMMEASQQTAKAAAKKWTPRV